MSILNELAKLSGERRLSHLLPLEPSHSVERDVYVSESVWDFLDGDVDDENLARVGARAYRRLESFIRGKPVVLGMDPRQKDRTSLIARNDDPADGVVDVRVNDPKPAVRIFGCFAAQNVLILLLVRTRSDLAKKGFAGSVKECRRHWDTLFPGYAPLVSENPNDYLTGTFDIG